MDQDSGTPKSSSSESKHRFMTHIEAIAARFEDALKTFTQQNSSNQTITRNQTSEIVRPSTSGDTESVVVYSETKHESNTSQLTGRSNVGLPLQLKSEDRSRSDRPPVPRRRERLFSRSVNSPFQNKTEFKNVPSEHEKLNSRLENDQFLKTEQSSHLDEGKQNVSPERERLVSRSENVQFRMTSESKQLISGTKDEKLIVPPERKRLVVRSENAQFQMASESKLLTSNTKDGQLNVPPESKRLVSRSEKNQFCKTEQSKQLISEKGKLSVPSEDERSKNAQTRESQELISEVRDEKPIPPERERLVSRLESNQFPKYKESKLLISAAKEGNLDVVKWIIQHGADPNVVDSKGRTALLTAACFDRLGVFKYLLPISDINMVDENGWNVLHVAAVAGYLRIIEEAISKVSIDNRSFSGLTPLCLAVNKGYLHIVEYLIREGADVSVTSNQGWTPIHFAAKRKHHPILYVLIHSFKTNCDLNKKTGEGETPLSLAVREGCFNCVRLLLDSGADPNSRDNKGWTPARISAINNYKEISQYLANYGATI